MVLEALDYLAEQEQREEMEDQEVPAELVPLVQVDSQVELELPETQV